MPQKTMCILGALALSSLAAGEKLLATEILGRPTDQGVTVNAVAGYATSAYVRYGLQSGVYSDSTAIQSFGDSAAMVLELQGLLPNRQYYYQLVFKSNAATSWTVNPEHFFRTQRSAGSTFSFNIIADAHMHDKKGIASVMTQTMNNQLLDIPDFLIDLGDNFGDDHNPTTISKAQLWTNRFNMRSYYGMLNHSSPLFLVMGNHEGESGYWLQNGGTNQMALQATLGRKFYYNNPVPNAFYSGNSQVEGNGIGLPENYYAWTWGDALFVVLDGYRGYTVNAKPRSWEWTLGKAQYDWFKQTLEKSQAKYKFVFAHHVAGETRGGAAVAHLYEWGGYTDSTLSKYEFDNNRPGWGLPIHQLMVQNHVNIFFQGHDHLFARENVDGVVYQTCPMPSDSTYRIGIHDNGDAFVSDTLEGSGHMHVTVSAGQTDVQYVTSYLSKDETATRKNNAIAFSYSISENGESVAIQDAQTVQQNGLMHLSRQTLGFVSTENQIYQVRLFNAEGKQIWNTMGQAKAGENVLRLEHMLAEGNYLVHIQLGQKSWAQQFQVSGFKAQY